MEKKNLILLWSAARTLDHPSHKIIREAPEAPEYILGRVQLGNKIYNLIDEIKANGIDYFLVNDLTNIDDVYSLVSYLKTKDRHYAHFVFSDEKTQLAASIILREVFGREHDAANIAVMKDKRLMKLAFSDIVDTARYMSLPDFVASLNCGKEAKITFPIVLKPVNGAGSSETFRISSEAELWSQIKELQHPHIDYIVEELIGGDEYNVDAIWKNGEPLYFFIGRYIVPRLEGYYKKVNKITMYLPVSEHDWLYQSLEKRCRGMMESIGFRDGITHAEFFVNGRDIVLGEIAARQAGGGMSAAVRTAVGEGLFELGVRSKVGTLDDSTAAHRILNGYYGFVDLRPAASGIIKKLIDKSELLAIDGVVDVEYAVRVGDFIGNFARSSWGVLAIIRADTEEDFNRIAEMAKKKFYCDVEE